MEQQMKRVAEDVRIPVRDKNVTLILVDVRDGKNQTSLVGRMKVPTWAMKQGEKVNWKVDGIKKAPQGVVCDVTNDSLNIVFAFVEEVDAQDDKGKDLAFRDLVDLFRKYDPAFLEVADL